jgi:hypothetical protein
MGLRGKCWGKAFPIGLVLEGRGNPLSLGYVDNRSQ